MKELTLSCTYTPSPYATEAELNESYKARALFTLKEMMGKLGQMPVVPKLFALQVQEKVKRVVVGGTTMSERTVEVTAFLETKEKS